MISIGHEFAHSNWLGIWVHYEEEANIPAPISQETDAHQS